MKPWGKKTQEEIDDREGEQEPPEGAPSENAIKEVASFLKTLIIFVAAAFLLRGSVVEAFKIPSGSMIPTLRIGDHILVTKLSYGLRLPFVNETLYRYSEPRRGDVVVFTRPDDPMTIDDESSINIIKRVIGLPGDTVEVKNTKVFVNNRPLSESYARWADGGIREGNFGPEHVPEGHVFVLGDNRDHSKDSRFWQSPWLPLDRVKGRAIMIYWSWDDPTERIGRLIR